MARVTLPFWQAKSEATSEHDGSCYEWGNHTWLHPWLDYCQQVWFQNRRAKWRRQEKLEAASTSNSLKLRDDLLQHCSSSSSSLSSLQSLLYPQTAAAAAAAAAATVSVRLHGKASGGTSKYYVDPVMTSFISRLVSSSSTCDSQRALDAACICTTNSTKTASKLPGFTEDKMPDLLCSTLSRAADAVRRADDDILASSQKQQQQQQKTTAKDKQKATWTKIWWRSISNMVQISRLWDKYQCDCYG